MEYQKLASKYFAVILISTFMISFGVLAFQVLLTRIFSVLFDYHYAFLVVSLALFGLGLGGIFVEPLLGKVTLNKTFGRLAILSTLFCLSLSFFVFIAVSVADLNVAIAAFLMFVPFMISGMLLATTYKVFVSNSGMLHFSDLAGAAVGALAAFFLLNLVGAVIGVIFVGFVVSLASLFFAFSSKRKIVIGIALLAVVVTGVFVSFSNTGKFHLIPNFDQEKEVTDFLSDPSLNAKIVDSRWSSFGQVDLLASPALPHNKIIFVDGSAGTSLYHFDGNFNSTESIVPDLKGSTQYFPYYFVNKGNSLVIGPGGGLDVLTALMADVNHINVVEVNQRIVDIVRDYSGYDGGIFSDYPNVHVNVDEGRSFLKRSDEKFDIIMLDIPITKTAQGKFGYELAENYLFTTDSFVDYLNHLNDDGFLTVVAHNNYEIYKLTSIALQVLRSQGMSVPQIMQRIAVVGEVDEMGHNHSSLPLFMLKKTPISEVQASEINLKAKELGLSSLYTSYPDYESSDGILLELAREQLSIDELLSETSFNMKASTDDNPFFYNFGSGIPGTLWVLLFVTIGLSVVVSLLYVQARKRQEVTFNNGVKKVLRNKFSGFKWYCFASLGLGFMLIEIALIQQFILFLGEPTLAIAVSLFSLLIAGGFGSFFSRKWGEGKQSKAFLICAVLACLVVAYMFVLPYVLSVTLILSVVGRFFVSFMLIFPLGFLMGIPFPTFLGYNREESDNDTAWIWCINGAFSVLAGSLALVIAMFVGFKAVLLLGALTYLGVFIVGRVNKRNNEKRTKWVNTQSSSKKRTKNPKPWLSNARKRL